MNQAQPILLHKLQEARSQTKKLLAVLIDPDKPGEQLGQFVSEAEAQGVDLFLVGGSLLMSDGLDHCIAIIRQHSTTPVYLFPSSPAQISNAADGILFLSLISGRNADLLIGRQVEAAPILTQTDLHVMSTGYMLIDCGNVTTAHYMSQSQPIPHLKADIAAATALAGAYLGLSCVYMDGGSGAKQPIASEMIKRVAESCPLPLIVGGGIRDASSAKAACQSGADMIVIGNAFETQPELLQEICDAVHSI